MLAYGYGYAFVLIVNRDAKPVKEADQPQHLPWYGSWQTLGFCNRYGRFPAEVINLQAYVPSTLCSPYIS
jgi:hypothetical protein